MQSLLFFGIVTPRLIVFVSSNVLFSISLFLSCIFLIVTAALAFGGLNETWEKRSAKALLFSTVPVYVWTVYFFWPVFSPLLWTVLIWVLFVLLLLSGRIGAKVKEKKILSETGSWRCPQCSEINESVFLVCKKCKNAKPK